MIKPYLLPLLLIATPIHAQSLKVWEDSVSGSNLNSTLELHEPTDPAAVATVTFRNETVHSGDEQFTLTYDGLTVLFLFDWQFNDSQAERVTIEPPDGYVARPYEIVVSEGQTAVAHIYKWEGM